MECSHNVDGETTKRKLPRGNNVGKFVYNLIFTRPSVRIFGYAFCAKPSLVLLKTTCHAIISLHSSETSITRQFGI